MFSSSRIAVRHLLSVFLISLTIAFNLPGGQESCTACQPNPIVNTYPSNVTGTINGTISVIIIDLAYARSIIPSQYPILNNAYTRFGIPNTSYPVIVETTIDHDIRLHGLNLVQDFSSLRITFPFLDRLNDGYSNLRWSPYIALPASNGVAIAGAEAYGEKVDPATFDPRDAGWTSSPDGSILFQVYTGNASGSGNPQPDFILRMEPKASIGPYPIPFYMNVTNQPMFGGNQLCDNMIRLWNTSVSQGEFAPKGTEGLLWFGPRFTGRKVGIRDVHGIRGDTAFIENNYVRCDTLKGYGGTGTGDSG